MNPRTRAIMLTAMLVPPAAAAVAAIVALSLLITVGPEAEMWVPVRNSDGMLPAMWAMIIYGGFAAFATAISLALAKRVGRG